MTALGLYASLTKSVQIVKVFNTPPVYGQESFLAIILQNPAEHFAITVNRFYIP